MISLLLLGALLAGLFVPLLTFSLLAGGVHPVFAFVISFALVLFLLFIGEFLVRDFLVGVVV